MTSFERRDVIAASPATTRATSFQFGGERPVHPTAVVPLVGDLADELPNVAAIDLEGSAANKSNRAPVESAGEQVESRDGNGGFAAYRLVGTTPGGLQVLIVMVNGGGSGIFEDVLWVRLVHDRVFDGLATRDRTMLVKVGSFTLGDRDDGNVRLDGRTLFIGRSRYRSNDVAIELE